LLLDLLTPIAKSWPAQWCVAANDLAIQVHGGYGYTRDFPVEQLYRDNRLNPIHEGTHGIQALDLLGRRVGLSGGEGFELLCATIGSTIVRARSDATGGTRALHNRDFGAYADALEAAVGQLVATTRALQAVAEPARRLANASIYLEAFGHVVAAWIWLEQALVAGGRPGAFYDGKRQACRWFYRCELPRTTAQFELLDRLDDTTLTMRDEWY